MYYDKTDQLDTLKAAPPAIVSLAHIIGWSIADWVQFITLIYLILSHKIYAWVKEVQSKK